MGLLKRMRIAGRISYAMLLNGEHFGGVISFLNLFGKVEFQYYKAFLEGGEGYFFGISDEMS